MRQKMNVFAPQNVLQILLTLFAYCYRFSALWKCITIDTLDAMRKENHHQGETVCSPHLAANVADSLHLLLQILKFMWTEHITVKFTHLNNGYHY